MGTEMRYKTGRTKDKGNNNLGSQVVNVSYLFKHRTKFNVRFLQSKSFVLFGDLEFAIIVITYL